MHLSAVSQKMNLDERHQELPTMSSGCDLSSPTPTDGAKTNYALIKEGNNLQSPSQHTHQNGIASASSQQPQSARVEIDSYGGAPPYLLTGHVEGFIVSKLFCSPSHHLYPRFADFPTWNLAAPPTKPPESLFLSSIDDELWTEFSRAFSNDLRAGDWNTIIYKCIVISAIYLVATKVDYDNYPFLFVVALIIIFALIFYCLRPTLFDKVDNTVARFQSRFAKHGIRASVVYYTIRRGRMTAHSRYIVWTALPDPRTLNLV